VLLTVSQRLLILDTSTMQVTASCDLLMRQILHHDRFSRHMNNFPAVADAYYSSFHTYKGKILLLVLLLNSGKLTLVCRRHLCWISADMGRPCCRSCRSRRFHRGNQSHDVLLQWQVRENHAWTSRERRRKTHCRPGQAHRNDNSFVEVHIFAQTGGFGR
jgi:hypothetical protein